MTPAIALGPTTHRRRLLDVIDTSMPRDPPDKRQGTARSHRGTRHGRIAGRLGARSVYQLGLLVGAALACGTFGCQGSGSTGAGLDGPARDGPAVVPSAPALDSARDAPPPVDAASDSPPERPDVAEVDSPLDASADGLGADASQVPAAPRSYPKLLFSDEFDTAPLDIGMAAGTTWVPGWIAWNTRQLAGNGDRAWKQHDGEQGWTADWKPSGRPIGDALRSDPAFVAAHGMGPFNHEVSGGTLKMRALRVPGPLRNTDFGGFEFTGGMISTEDRFAFLHGWVEMRLRFNRVNQGMHFAFWTLSQDTKKWMANYGPELDALEVLYRDPKQGFERPEHWHQNAIGIPNRPGMTGSPWPFYVKVGTYSEWHTVAVERSPDDKLRFYIDGVLRREEDVSSRPQYRDERHFLLCSWEIGGNWPGAVTSSDPAWSVEVEIDYIRVFGP